MKLTESKLRSIIREELSRLVERPARTGTGGRRAMGDGKGKVFRVKNPNARYGGSELAVDAIVKPNGDVEVVRVLGFSSGKPPNQPVDEEYIEKMIRRGDAEEMPNIEFMADNSY